MAITQISQIKNRRGLEADLPQLGSAEFGWSLDSRRLYIGNGPTSEGAPVEGNTEIFTNVSIARGDIPGLTSFNVQTLPSNETTIAQLAGGVPVDLDHAIVLSAEVKYTIITEQTSDSKTGTLSIVRGTGNSYTFVDDSISSGSLNISATLNNASPRQVVFINNEGNDASVIFTLTTVLHTLLEN